MTRRRPITIERIAMRPLHERFAVWSILFFLVPWALAWSARIIPLAVVLTIVICLSFLNHLRKEKILRQLDAAFAWILMLLQLVLCVLGRFSMPFFLFVLILVPIALHFYYRRSREGYDYNHALWHLFSAAISVFAQLTYLAYAWR
jgi:hypothetical protein